ncbi:phosphate transport system substrate-binding protein [Sphingomonas kyeonggiensis]|uniref:Phosphate transport system substrate-binding protein n=1 Tax=Sphingomonas kyeonggiensis TaxID=1268553 RepID=A0A7W7K4P2_9SPHN|nr:substrate-binding domain-containing protein [Sphingomonas kyeonggiensis]MBB4840989.1 phosphate transport system substrate-binding protein [Sphingomonas kyeonggiensis]
MLRRTSAVTLAALLLASCNTSPSAITATGSATVFPFTKAVGEAFVKKDKKQPMPEIAAVGTGEGARAFCKPVNGKAPDLLDASRRMTRVEFNACNAAGAGDILEIRIGLDGLALAGSVQGPKLELTSQDIYLALAANPRGKPNTAKTWHDVNARLPAIPILVLGHPKGSGTREMFEALILRVGCLAAMPQASELLKSPDPSQFDVACQRVRTDGAYVEKGEDDAEIVSALKQNPNALGLFGYARLEQNAAALRGVPIDGIAPDAKTISGGQYPGARTLFLYVRKARLKELPALKDFLKLYLEMAAPGGPLTAIGLVALPDGTRKKAAEALENEYPLEASELS